MSIRAVIFDVYHTLLQVGPPPDNAAEKWEVVWREFFDNPPQLSLREFNEKTDSLISSEHATARVRGIQYPEVYWPELAVKALPQLCALAPERRDEFLFQHAQLRHSTCLMPGAAEALSYLAQEGLLLGIVSNAQPYTLRELELALGTANLSTNLFPKEICFWSFKAGFSKPDPHVFQLVSARLKRFSIANDEILVVGDRLDNDIWPAQRHGWRTWQINSTDCSDDTASGSWPALANSLRLVGKQKRQVAAL
jgi:FMN phosphatase YigB (HAD superfamily)